MVHRPLSTWVSVVPLTTAGVARPGPADDVNFGDERADARGLPQFAASWQRRAIPVERGGTALGLVREQAGLAALELDDLCRPVPVTEAGAAAIAAVEEAWPDARAALPNATVLAEEDVLIRHLLLTRLAADGDVPAELFHILPWHLVDQLAGGLTAMLGGAAPGPLIELQYWFTSTGSRFTAALEQLDEGLRDADPALTRIGSAALVDRLLAVSAARLPAATREALAALAAALAERDPLPAFTARRAAARLRDDTDAAPPSPRLETLLPIAAAHAPGIRRMVRTETREPYTVAVAVTSTGQTEFNLRAPVEPSLDAWLGESYGVVLQPVRIRGDVETVRCVIALTRAPGEVFGGISVPSPAGRFIEAELDGAPIGSAEARFLDPEVVRRSVAGVRDRSARLLWRQVADSLPAGHPLRQIIAGLTR